MKSNTPVAKFKRSTTSFVLSLLFAVILFTVAGYHKGNPLFLIMLIRNVSILFGILSVLMSIISLAGMIIYASESSDNS